MGVNTAGTGGVASRPVGYERGSTRLVLERDEVDELLEGAPSLLLDKVENVDVIDRRDRHDEFDDDEDLVEVLFVDVKDGA